MPLPCIVAGVLIAAAIVSGCSRDDQTPLRRQTVARATVAATPVALPRPVVEGDTVVVRRGQSISTIAAGLGVGYAALVAANPEVDPDRIVPGQRLNLPRPEAPIPTAPRMASEDLAAARQAAGLKPPSLSGDGFLVPVSGKVIAGFGEQADGSRNDGVNIEADRGATVRAAENGVVVYVGSKIKSFGKMILVRHAQGFVTTYAHVDSVLVKTGDAVSRGQKIATVGNSGAVREPQLHFELREGSAAVDPSRWLEGWTKVTVATR